MRDELTQARARIHQSLINLHVSMGICCTRVPTRTDLEIPNAFTTGPCTSAANTGAFVIVGAVFRGAIGCNVIARA